MAARNPAGPSDEARARSAATRSRRAAAAKALAALDVIAADPGLDGSDQAALDDVRALLSRYSERHGSSPAPSAGLPSHHPGTL